MAKLPRKSWKSEAQWLRCRTADIYKSYKDYAIDIRLATELIRIGDLLLERADQIETPRREL